MYVPELVPDHVKVLGKPVGTLSELHRMWPVITALARSYAPQIVFPAALVMGFIGEAFLPS